MEDIVEPIATTPAVEQKKKSPLLLIGVIVFIAMLVTVSALNKNAVLNKVLTLIAPLRRKMTLMQYARDTAKWQTFTSPSRSFTVKIPQGWNETSNAIEPEIYYLTPPSFDDSDYVDTPQIGRAPYFPIEFNESPISSAAGAPIENEIDRYQIVDSIQTITQTGAVVGTPLEGRVVTEVRLNKNDKQYTITLFNQKYADVFQEVLSTFHFK